MSRIKQLPEEVANQISAGEVVERPASVVKELVENSIDAESDKILIEIENGGKDLIRVKDNGQGIEQNEVELAFSRYATSKIEHVNDIYSLHTLGFRGEALASIASVSEVEVLTRSEGAVKGTKLEINGGKITDKKVTGCPQGTDIKVKNIFYNTPARFKYMKTKNTEFGHISRAITQEALTYPEISFKLKHNDRNVISTPGTGKLKETIYSLYGREVVDKLIEIDYEENYIKLSGFIAHPSLSRSSRVHEMFFVNKRPVYNRALQQGVEAGYRGLISGGKYPVVFLFVKLNPILVDVNVHPAKKKVKFSRNQVVKTVIKRAVRETLKTQNLAVKYNFSNNGKDKTREKPSNYKQTDKNSGYNNNISGKTKEKTDSNHRSDNSCQNNTKDKDNNNDSNSVMKLNFSNDTKQDSSVNENNDFNNISSSNNYNNDDNKKKNIKKSGDKIKSKDNKKTQDKEKNTVINNTQDIKCDQTIEDKNNKNNFNIHKILGQIYSTYIVAAGSDGLMIIDQHNAHERILFDRFYHKFKKNNTVTKQLLTPLTLELTVSEMEIVNKNMKQLKELGFMLESFGGNSFVIREVPDLIRDRSPREIVKEIIDTLIKEGEVNNRADLVEEIIQYMACRSAVKAEERLSPEEMDSLVSDLMKVDNPYRCPHGRPIIMRLSKRDLEKGVGR